MTQTVEALTRMYESMFTRKRVIKVLLQNPFCISIPLTKNALLSVARHNLDALLDAASVAQANSSFVA